MSRGNTIDSKSLCAEHISKCPDGAYRGYWYKRIFELENGKKYDTFPFGVRGNEILAKQMGLKPFIVFKGKVIRQN